jgi:carbamate kinase
VRVVVALGGNAILARGARGSAEEQRDAIRVACTGLADLVEAGHDLVLTHGNGPQVGRLLLAQRAARDVVEPLPLDVLGAQTQGALGYLLQQQLGNVLRARGIDRSVVSVVTQVIADPQDPAFGDPDKPVGPHYTETELDFLAHKAGQDPDAADDAGGDREIEGARYRRVEGGTWRRVVASPQPIDIVEAPAVRALLERRVLPVCCGGGGAPVAPVGRGRDLVGLEAVVDKDRTAALLTRLLAADLLLILTDVERVILDYGKPTARPLDRMTPEEARKHLADGQFPPGSMGPKVTAALDVAARGGRAVITSLDHAAAALAGTAGTEIAPV